MENTMYELIIIMSFFMAIVSLICSIIGLIKPELLHFKSKSKAFTTNFTLFFVLYTAGLLLNDIEDNKNINNATNDATNEETNEEVINNEQDENYSVYNDTCIEMTRSTNLVGYPVNDLLNSIEPVAESAMETRQRHIEYERVINTQEEYTWDFLLYKPIVSLAYNEDASGPIHTSTEDKEQSTNEFVNNLVSSCRPVFEEYQNNIKSAGCPLVSETAREIFMKRYDIGGAGDPKDESISELMDYIYSNVENRNIMWARTIGWDSFTRDNINSIISSYRFGGKDPNELADQYADIWGDLCENVTAY